MAKSGQALLENARVQAFLSTVRSQCQKCNVKFILANANYVGGKSKQEQLLGFFWEPTMNRTGSPKSRYCAGMLKVARKRWDFGSIPAGSGPQMAFARRS